MDVASRIWKMRTDGSFLETTPLMGRLPDWQPIPGIAGYPRPKAASPLSVSLVPAQQACIDPNRSHGPPIDEPSCAPPLPASSHLTVGTPDSNGRTAWSTGRLRFDTVVGNPGTVADEADVAIAFELTDVRRAGDLSDYDGELRAEVALQIVDRNNSGVPPAATMVPTVFGLTIPCATTGDANIGGRCALETTADALAPGIVVEGSRAIWEAGAARVLDGGADEDADTSADNELFATQGIFVP